MKYTPPGDIFYFDAMFSDEMELLILIYCQIRSRVGRKGEEKEVEVREKKGRERDGRGEDR